MPLIRTRIATLSDLDVVAPLFDAYRQFYGQPSDLILARRFLRDRMSKEEAVVLVAANGSENVVGFCQLYPTFCSLLGSPIYSLYDLFVVPEGRRSGTARALLKAAETLAAKTGRARLDLTTARTNIAAQSAYESLGWVRDEVFYAYSKAIDI